MAILDLFKDIKKVILLIILILCILYLVRHIYKQYKKYRNTFKHLFDIRHGKKYKKIKSKDLPRLYDGNEYTYSFWLFIDDWEYKYGKPKCVFYRGDSDGNNSNPSVWLYPKENKLMIRFQTFTYGSERLSMPEMNPLKNPSILNDNMVCDIDNIPLQKWVHVVIVLWNRTSDVYIDGKLTRSCILPGVPQMNEEHLHVTPHGGFSGNISKMLVISRAWNPDAIYDEYLKGPLDKSLWKRLFGNINLGISIKAKSGDHEFSSSSD